jgi:hypothetical protein
VSPEEADYYEEDTSPTPTPTPAPKPALLSATSAQPPAALKAAAPAPAPAPAAAAPVPEVPLIGAATPSRRKEAAFAPNSNGGAGEGRHRVYRFYSGADEIELP